MFLADIRAMDEATTEMQQQIRKLNQAIYETESVISGLNSMSGMRNVKYSLQKELERIETELRYFQSMLATLNQIQRCYGSCEDCILNYAEGIQRRKPVEFEWFPIGFSEDVAQLVKSIVY